MKKMMFVLCMFSLPLIMNAQAGKGMEFFKGSFDEALAKAKETNKVLFVDVYTTWCGPCKSMADHIFPLPEVGEKYNTSFINYQMDAEKGEGIELAKKYKVASYPTFLYINHAGELIHRYVGYSQAPSVFLGHADKAIEYFKVPRSVYEMENTYRKGKKDLQFLKDLVIRQTEFNHPTDSTLDDYLKLSPEKDKADFDFKLFLLSHVKNAHTETFRFLMDSIAILYHPSNKLRQSPISYKIPSLVMQALYKAGEAKDLVQMEKMLKYVDRLPKTDKVMSDFLMQYRLKYAAFTGNFEMLDSKVSEYLAEAEAAKLKEVRKKDARYFEDFMSPYLEGYQDSTASTKFQEEKRISAMYWSKYYADKLYYVASLYDEEIKDKARLKKAIQWIDKAILLLPEDASFVKLRESLKAKRSAS